jgi:GTP-binding protein
MSKLDFQNGFALGLASSGIVESGDNSRLNAFENYIDEKGYELIYISAATGENVSDLITLVAERLRFLPPLTVYEKEYVEEEAYDPKDKSVKVRNVNGVYEVEGDWLYRFMGTINFGERESLMFFQKVLKDNGGIDALEDAGCGEGDTVSIYDFEFDFVK